jgi:peptide/nickel transport system permease protein
MLSFMTRRLILGLVALLGVLIVTFTVIKIAPIDPARMYAGPRASDAQLAAATQELGLDKPMGIQLVSYIRNFFTGQWGKSLVSRGSVAREVGQTLPYTLELVFITMVVQNIIGISLGVLSAHRKDEWPDHMGRVLAVGLVAIPTFWLALGLQYILTGKLGWLPLSGAFDYDLLMKHPLRSITGVPLIDALVTWNLPIFWDHIVHMVMPVFALACMGMGTMQRLTRSTLIEVMSEDYIVAVRSYGAPESDVLWRHGMKNAVGPLATFIALSFAWVLVNTFIIESIFAWPGVGSYIVNAVAALDYPAVIAVVALSAVSYLVLNTLADMALAIDPRVRLG